MDLLVSYYWNHFSRARREAAFVLRKFGDPAPQIERTGVIGIAVVHTSLNNRDVIRKCKELFKAGFAFRFAIKWVPADFWCETSLDSIKKVIDENVVAGIGEHETWGMKVEKRRWQKYHTIEIIEHLAAGISRKVNLSNPDKLIRVDVLGEKTAISLLKPGETFSTTAAMTNAHHSDASGLCLRK
ncbi:MAG TPA: THUMP domain-containing protein [Candidatus Binataceae bacterium]|nr:THUMP domain-containing protein [Candidatus Binataceae bacterium]